MFLDVKPSILIFITCTSLIVVAVILCCFCIIGGGYKKKDAHELPTPSVSIRRSRPFQMYHDVEFGQGFRTYRQDMTPRSEHTIFPITRGSPRSEQSIRPDTRGSRRSERIDRQESGIKESEMAVLAGAGAAIASAAAILGLSSDQGGEDIGGSYVDSCDDSTNGDGHGAYSGGGGGGCGNVSQL